jgi:hypothetical protein
MGLGSQNKYYVNQSEVMMPKSLQRMGLRAEKAPRPWGPPTGADAGATGSVRNPQKSKFQKNLEKIGQEVVRAAYLFVISALVASCGLLGGAIALPDPEELPALGMTECYTRRDGVPYPVAWINADVLKGPDEEGTVAHERKHSEQVRRFPNCGSFQMWYQSNMADAEAEAFCEEIRVDVKENYRTRDEAFKRYGRWLAGYNVGLTEQQAEALLRKTCS